MRHSKNSKKVKVYYIHTSENKKKKEKDKILINIQKVTYYS